ncbi:MAG: DUF2147 domain-containing protein [Ferruginibacter sp.]
MNRIYITIIFSCWAFIAYSQHDSDRIVGRWINVPKENVIIEVYKSGQEYKGRIVWSKDNDKKKPVGFIILEKLAYDTKTRTWQKGVVHDPSNENTYNASAQINSDSTLELHAYAGLRFLGTKKSFKRAAVSIK